MASSHLETAIRINIDTREGVGNVEALNTAVKKTLQQLGRGADFDALEKLRQQAADGKSVGWATKLPPLLTALAAKPREQVAREGAVVRDGHGFCSVRVDFGAGRGEDGRVIGAFSLRTKPSAPDCSQVTQRLRAFYFLNMRTPARWRYLLAAFEVLKKRQMVALLSRIKRRKGEPASYVLDGSAL